jgi:hypothetical protein
MAKRTRKPIIDIPVKMLFTEQGVSFFLKNNKKLNRFDMADNTKQYGLLINQVTPVSMQNMINIGYVSRIEISRPEFMSKRSEIMDLSKLISYSFFYRQFDEEVAHLLQTSETIKSWNRSNPSNIIDNKTRIKDSVLKPIIEQSKSRVQQIKNTIMHPVMQTISKNETMGADEKNVQIFLCEKFLNSISPFSWFVMVKFYSSFEYDDVFPKIEKILAAYIQRSSIAEYLSLVLMELNLSAEARNMRTFVDSKYQGTISYESIVFDPEKKGKLMAEMEKAQAFISVAWKIGAKTEHSIGMDKRLEVSVYNKEAEFVELKEALDKKMNSDIRHSTLVDFYRGSESNSAEIGLNYLSYLLEECEKVGIKFSSRVNEIRGGKSFITLAIQF